MKIHYIQHVPFETPGTILEWVKKRHYSLSHTFLFNNETFPPFSQFDFLVIMGGPMNIYEYHNYPWLKKEKKFIAQSLQNNKKIIGICLGAQLIADVLGAKVYKNKEKEIGFFPISLSKEARNYRMFDPVPNKFTPLHWHGDTFELPHSATRIAENSVTQNQAFLYNNQVLAFQFHLEANHNSLFALITNAKSDLQEPGKFIQNKKKIFELYQKNAVKTRNILFPILDNLSAL